MNRNFVKAEFLWLCCPFSVANPHLFLSKLISLHGQTIFPWGNSMHVCYWAKHFSPLRWGKLVACLLECSTHYRKIVVSILGLDNALCPWTKHFKFTLLLCTPLAKVSKLETDHRLIKLGGGVVGMGDSDSCKLALWAYGSIMTFDPF